VAVAAVAAAAPTLHTTTTMTTTTTTTPPDPYPALPGSCKPVNENSSIHQFINSSIHGAHCRFIMSPSESNHESFMS